jgi:hypothetical protein
MDTGNATTATTTTTGEEAGAMAEVEAGVMRAGGDTVAKSLIGVMRVTGR